jgi:hypothetical protein
MTVVEVIGTAASLLAVIGVLGKILILNPLKNLIKESTYPIQPNANGGRSLPDIAKAVDRIEKRLDEHINFHLKDNHNV